MEGVAVARFQAQDVVRHPLVERIVKAYDAEAARAERQHKHKTDDDQH